MAPERTRRVREAGYLHLNCQLVRWWLIDASGLALSGGVDSMALAFLCHRFICQSGRRPLDEQYQSFIVDHKAREGSTEEAGLVDRRLERLLGMSFYQRQKPPINGTQVLNRSFSL
jgi:hypothetical protein